MAKFKLTLTLDAPLTIGAERQGYITPTLEYIPGSTLRGAFAAWCLRSMAPEDQRFQDWFASDQALWQDLYPVDHVAPVSRLPLTAVSCKRVPGAKAAGGHGVHDRLFELAMGFCFPAVQIPLPQCPSCGQDMKTHTGYVNGQDVLYPDTSRLIQMHVGIDPETGSHADGVLFGQTAVNRTTVFTGILDLPADLCTFLEAHKRHKGLRLRLGKSRTRGYGAASVQWTAIEPSSQPDIVAWDRAYRQYLHQHGLEAQSGTYFSLNFESHALLVDAFLRPSDTIEEWMLGLNVKRQYTVLQSTTVSGWNIAWGLPKTDEWAIQAGSVMLFHTPSVPQAVQEALEPLRLEGVGMRRNEGFGRINYCLPWHIVGGSDEHV